MLVAYSTTGAGSPPRIPPDLKPQADEHVVKASVDKFFGTDLEAYLKSKGITQVPVDGTASSSLYAEQYVAWHLQNAPTVRGNVILTRCDLLGR